MLRFSRKGISVTVVLDRRRAKMSGLYPVKIEVVWQGKQKYFPTGVDMSAECWDKMRTRHKASKEMTEIEQCFNKIRNEVAELLENGCFSIRVLETRCGRTPHYNVNQALRSMMEQCKHEGRINSYYRHRSTLVNVEKFAGDTIPFSSVTVVWLNRCEDFWIREGKSTTTVCIYMKTLKSVMYKALDEGYIKHSQFPFGRGGYAVPKGAVRKMALTKSQIKRIVEYRGPSELEMYRDLWLFSYLCNGINFKDMLFLKHKDIVDGEIHFIRSKTRYAYGTRKVIHANINPKMQEILDKWGNPATCPDRCLFRYADGNEDCFKADMLVRKVVRKCNAALKVIAHELDIPAFTTYAARHSFATIMQRSGVGLPFISECLGHSSLVVTENYLAGFGMEDRARNSALLTDFD